MRVRRLRLAEAAFERSPGQDADIFTADGIDASDGGPVTVGHGRYGPDQSLTETMKVHDTMIVLEGRLTVESRGETLEAGVGDIVHMPKDETVTIRAGADGAVTAYVTWPHWREAAGD
ncbi:ethanolamine utilization protein [Brevundimonas sp. GCM10030266]|uniref:ethanolamine utilization protein n=1 Tax=Brevundimonas sp. GCM10030266 TaxID=3273386 RepID=UPI00360A13E8